MSYKFSESSLKRLDTVHPDLQEVVIRALEISEIDFGVACGARTVDEQMELVKDGKSQTMNSRHIPSVNDSGFCEAVDLYAYTDKAEWGFEHMRKVAQAMFIASAELATPIEWGGLWENSWDCPHFQLKY